MYGLRVIMQMRKNPSYRYSKLYSTVVGLVFHGCLLLVLTTWRPSGDDPALFHVISAAWGVCNSIWETLIYSKFFIT